HALYANAAAVATKLVADFPDEVAYQLELALCNNNLGAALTDLERMTDAESAFRNAVTVLEKLTAEFPSVPQYAIDLGAGYLNFGEHLRVRGQPENGLAWYGKAIGVLQPVVERDAQIVRPRQLLSDAHGGRGQVLRQLQRHGEALADWKRALELNPSRLERVRYERAVSLVSIKKFANALADADALAETQDP